MSVGAIQAAQEALYQEKRKAEEDQAALWVSTGFPGEQRALIDPNALSKDNTVSLDWWYPSPTTQSQVVAAGETGLDEDGRFHLRFTPEAEERMAERGVTYRYRVGVDVTDEGGETRSAERSFRLGFVSVEARIVAEVGFLSQKERASLRVLRTDLDEKIVLE